MIEEIKVGDTIRVIGMYRDFYKNHTMEVIRIRKSRKKELLNILYFDDPYQKGSVTEEFRYNVEKVLS